MGIITIILAVLVALEHFYIMFLETFQTTSKKTAQTFNIHQDVLQDKNIQTLFKNQGVYNGAIGLGILYGLFVAQSAEIVALLLVFVIVVAVYGSLTSSKSIIMKQGGPAILAFISLFIF